MKKALSLILVLVMLIGLMPMQVFATEGTQETEAVEVVTEPTEAPEEETTAPTENTEITEESTEEATESEEADEPVMPLGLEPINSQWSGKTAAFVGDSITAGSGTTKIYYQYLEEAIGFRSVMAMGVAGSCISIASDYGTGNQPLINRYQNIPEADLIVVFMGTNDYGHETPLGSVVDEQDGTFYGALNVIVPALVAKHPFSKIVFVTPLHRYGFGTSKILGTQFTSDDVANGVGATLGDYVDALKTVCANNGVSVIDLYTECTLDPADVEVRSVYMPDGLHPNATGHEVIAEIMASHIRGYEPTEKEPEIDPEPEEETELIYGNKFASGFTQQNRASARVNQYLKAGTVITLKKPEIFQWSCAKTSGETSSNNLGYFPGSAWTDQETAVVKADGWVGFVFKYRDETQFFDLTKPLSDYITIEEPHTHNYGKTVTAPTCTEQGYTTYTCACGDSYVADYVDATGHTYKNGICTGCGEEDYDGLDLNGLNVLCLGDSITAGQGLTTETRWTNVLASKYGWNLTNKSQGGISLSSYYYTTNGTTDVSIAKKAEVLKTMTTKPDVIIVWGGHNDTGYRYSPLGTWDDETADSFKGALKYIAELAEEYAPDATLFVLTPFLLNETPSTLKVPANTSDNNWMFVDAIYDGAEAYGWIPINMDLCGITPFTKTGLLLDNIHPNAAGTEKIVEYLSAELASYGENSKKDTILFNKSDFSMKTGESTTLKAVQSPRSGTGTMTFTWSSSDSSVATVDANGKIIAVAPGNVIITATTANGISAGIGVSVVCEHTYETTVTAPTCTEQGYTTYTCACGDSYVDDYVDAEGEHDFTDWYTTKEAFYNADGEESRDCKKCSHVEFRSVKLEVVTSGNVGKGTPYTDDVTYTLYADGTMVISGNGIVYCSDWRGDYQPYKDYRTQVKTLIVEDGITTTAGGCFAHFYNLETVSLPDSLTKIDGNAFMSSFSSVITSIVIPETVTYIGAYSYGFYYGKGGTTFTDVVIENPNVRLVDHKAVFNAGNNLANLTLYSYGTNNNVSAYAQKYGCKYVDLEAYKTGVYSGVEYMYYDGVLTLSAAQSDATIAGEDAPWNAEKNNIQKIVIESGITGIAANAFKDYYNLESIEINNEICSVGDGAFSTTESCDRALNLALPRTVKRVGSGIFAGRKNVTLTAYLGSAAAEINAPGVKLDLKKQFKLLLIGNSYSEDASSCGQGMQDSQLLNVLQAMLGEDAEVTVALLSSGGKGINWHATQAEQGNAAYSFKIISSNSPTWTTIGSASSYQALTWTDWDVVSLQPYNISASTGIEAVAYPDGTDMKFRDLKTASEYLLDYIGTHAPDADIYCYMHWAQTTGTTLNANLSYYNRLAPHYLAMMEHKGTTTGTKYTSLIPVGLSIQNARSTYLALLAYNTDTTLNLTTDTQMGLQRDGGHLSFNVGRYIAGLTFAEMIVPEEWRAADYVLPEIRITESVGKLPKEYSVIAQKAVLAAVNSWKSGSLAVTNIDGYTQDPTVAASELLQAGTFRLNSKEESLMTQLETAVLAALPADFVVSKIEIDEDTMTAAVTIRFGYTSAIATVSYTTSAPVITQQPESVEQEIGKKFAITVKAEGEGLTYQWYVKEAGAKTFKASVNKTSSYAYTMQDYMHNRQVYCVVTDANGNSIQTETATITRPPQALRIVEQPQDARVNVGEKFSISPKVEGEGLTYQWYVKESGAKAFKVSSIKGSAYALTMQKYMIGRQVYCVITDKYGNSVTTDVATISLPPVELKILEQPSDVYAVKGEKFSISFVVQGDGLTYQWYYKESYMKDFKPSSNKTSAYAYSMQNYMDGRSVYCVITDQYGNQVVTEAVTIHLEK